MRDGCLAVIPDVRGKLDSRLQGFDRRSIADHLLQVGGQRDPAELAPFELQVRAAAEQAQRALGLG